MKNEQRQIVNSEGHFSTGGSSPKFVKKGHGKIWHHRKDVENHIKKRINFLKTVPEARLKLAPYQPYDVCRVLHSFVDDQNVYHSEFFNVADFY